MPRRIYLYLAVLLIMFLFSSVSGDVASSGSGEVSSNQGRDESSEEVKKWNSPVRKPSSRNEEEENNMIRFEGVIYGFPGSAPGSQFALRAHVYVQTVVEQKKHEGSLLPARSPPTLTESRSSSSSPLSSSSSWNRAGTELIKNGLGEGIEEEKTLSGRIVHRKQSTRGNGLESPSSTDFIDGRIPVMKEFPEYHYRKRRNVFFDHVAGINRNLSWVSNINGTRDREMSPRNNALNFISDSHNARLKVGSDFGLARKGEPGPGVRRRRNKSASIPNSSPILDQVSSVRGRIEMYNLSGQTPLPHSEQHHDHDRRRRFSTWENFVKVAGKRSKRGSAARNNHVRKNTRGSSSTWANLL